MTLPPCVMTLPPGVLPPSDCPAGTHWDAALQKCVPDTTTPFGGQGSGNILYVSTWQGLALCTDAFGSDGTDGNETWTNLSTALSGASLKIHAFNLDPFSSNGDHLAIGWTLADDGIWQVTGLPDLPIWTHALTRADIATLVGHPVGELYFLHSLLLSVRTSGLIAFLVKWWDGSPPPYNYSRIYTIYSLDGLTWNCDNTKYVLASAALDIKSIYLQASYHSDNTYYLTGGLLGNQDGLWHLDDGSYGGTMVATSTDLQTWTPSMRNYTPYRGGWGTQLAQPYGDPNGVIYTDDKEMYVFGVEYADGTNCLRKYISFLNPLYPATPPPNFSDVGDAAMAWGHSNVGDSPCPYKLSIHAFNENKMVAIGQHVPAPVAIWLSSLGGSSWVQITAPVLGGRTAGTPTSVFQVPINAQVVFLAAGLAGGAGEAMILMTINFGLTFSDISKHGAADGLETVMALGSGDMTEAQIVVDAQYVGGVQASGTGTMVDVSHYQGAMDWSVAASTGITHAFMKATQGASYTDTQFATNWSGAHAQGIARGSYHYFENATNPTTQANHYVAVATQAGELSYAVDCEDETAALDPANLKIFLDRVETLTGQKCVIYTRASWWNRYVGYQSWASDYLLWVAHWNTPVPSLPVGWTRYAYWQYSNFGRGATYGAQSSFIDLDKVAA